VSIITVCPKCLNRYYVIPTMRGEAMRCLVCREIFVVKDEDETLPGKAATEPPAPEPNVN
jgi:hypothetical protein